MIDSELTPEERNAFATLPREREPSRLLEERTIAALRKRGYLRSGGRASRFLRAAAAAAVAAVFLSGFAAGRLTAPDRAIMDRESTGVDARARVSAGDELHEPSRIFWL